MWGTQINSAGEFLPALEEAFKQKGPAIIGVPVDYSENMRLTKHLGKVLTMGLNEKRTDQICTNQGTGVIYI